jgi:hypothetical protein
VFRGATSDWSSVAHEPGGGDKVNKKGADLPGNESGSRLAGRGGREGWLRWRADGDTRVRKPSTGASLIPWVVRERVASCQAKE